MIDAVTPVRYRGERPERDSGSALGEAARMSESEARTTTVVQSNPKTARAALRNALGVKQKLEGVVVAVSAPATAIPVTFKTKNKRAPRTPDPTIAERNLRIREIPREVSLKEFCERCDRLKIPFSVPLHFVNQGCPPVWSKAYKNEKWRRRIHDMRSYAWKNPRKSV